MIKKKWLKNPVAYYANAFSFGDFLAVPLLLYAPAFETIWHVQVEEQFGISTILSEFCKDVDSPDFSSLSTAKKNLSTDRQILKVTSVLFKSNTTIFQEREFLQGI